MADFRKWILALTVLVLFVGLASAQVNSGTGGTTPLACSANVAVTPQLRGESYTELVGDIVINCTGGTTPGTGTAAQGTTFGSQIQTANITVYLPGAVTSRLLSTSNGGSEALLLIDEPGSADGGYGPTVPVTVCPYSGTPGQSTNSCNEFIGNTATGVNVPVQTNPCPGGVCSTTALAAGWNAWQGLVNAGTVTFFGVPVLAPGTTGTRVFRITNVRVNANVLNASGPFGYPVNAEISTSNSTSLPLNTAQLTVGLIQPSLTTAVRNFGGGSVQSGELTQPIQCSNPNGSGHLLGQADLRFTEQFATAFKTRVEPGPNTAGVAPNPNGTGGTGQSATAVQNVPGYIYSSESGFIPYTNGAPSLQGNTNTAGLADFGTRLKAVFNNIPSGMSVYVSPTNIIAGNAGIVAATATTSYAVLVAGEIAPETYPLITQTGTTTFGGIGIANGYAATPYYQLPVVNNSATAVWEVYNTYPNLNENFEFAVWVSYTPSPATGSPAPGTMTVNMSYAPNPTQGAFTAAAGGAASASLPIPRFADTSVAANVAQVTICSTALLFPYVTNLSGFDTGIAIANTSVDPFGTGAQAGTCTLNWYGNATTTSNPAASTLGAGGVGSSAVIPAGVVVTALASTTVPGFQGYMIAVCQFQFAHGFAFISDLGARNLAMGYLALVMNETNAFQIVARPTGIGEGLQQ